MSRLTQRKMVFQLLKENPTRYMPVWWFIGERETAKYGWVFLSHRAPARLTELYQDGLIDRERARGRTGAYYFLYKYRPQE